MRRDVGGLNAPILLDPFERRETASEIALGREDAVVNLRGPGSHAGRVPQILERARMGPDAFAGRARMVDRIAFPAALVAMNFSDRIKPRQMAPVDRRTIALQ